MSTQFSPVIAARPQGNGGSFSAKSLDLQLFGKSASPVVICDDFRVRGRPFGPHPHAGFSTITYVLEDSPGELRSRDSLGNDLVVGPGGIVWTEAGSGMMHEESSADPGRELHGLQIFVNLSSKRKFTEPRVLRLDRGGVPQWRSDAGDSVQVVVGGYDGVLSPLVPAESFTLLDVKLRRKVTFEVGNDHNALVYVLTGAVVIHSDGREQNVQAEHAVAFHGGGRVVVFPASHPAQFLLLSGPEIREPVLMHGPFIMNDLAQINAAFARFRAGKMGHLAPLGE